MVLSVKIPLMIQTSKHLSHKTLTDNCADKHHTQTDMTFIKELSKIIPRSLSTSSKICAKIKIFPKYSLADDRLTSTILEDLRPHQTGRYR